VSALWVESRNLKYDQLRWFLLPAELIECRFRLEAEFAYADTGKANDQFVLGCVIAGKHRNKQ
jgi:hypothetical protein